MLNTSNTFFIFGILSIEYIDVHLAFQFTLSTEFCVMN